MAKPNLISFAVLWWTREPGNPEPCPNLAGVWRSKQVALAALDCIEVSGNVIGRCLVRWTPIDGMGFFNAHYSPLGSELESVETKLRLLASTVDPISDDLAWLCLIVAGSGIPGTWSHPACRAGLVPHDWADTLIGILADGPQKPTHAEMFFPVYGLSPYTQPGKSPSDS